MTTPVDFLHEHHLKPILNQEQLYRFATRFTDSFNKKHIVEKDCIRFITLTYYGTIDDLFVFKVLTNKVDVLFNQKNLENHLPKECIYAFDDVDLGVNEKGEIVKVFNLAALQKQWKRRKLELQEFNVGHELDTFLDNISNVLMNEENAIEILNLNSMFGFYFQGLFAKYDTNEVPKKRTVIVEEFDVALTEEIWAESKISGLKITAQKSNDAHKKIICDMDVIKKYEGNLMYNTENRLVEGFLEIKNENMNIKYKILWVG